MGTKRRDVDSCIAVVLWGPLKSFMAHSEQEQEPEAHFKTMS